MTKPIYLLLISSIVLLLYVFIAIIDAVDTFNAAGMVDARDALFFPSLILAYLMALFEGFLLFGDTK